MLITIVSISISIIFLQSWINPLGLYIGQGPPFRYFVPIIPLISIPFSLALQKFSKNLFYLIPFLILLLISGIFAFSFTAYHRLASIGYSDFKKELVQTVYFGIDKVFPESIWAIHGDITIIPLQSEWNFSNQIFIFIISIFLLVGLIVPFIISKKNSS